MRLPGCEGLLQVSLVEAACCMRLPRVSTLDATVGTLVLPKSTRGSGVVTQLPGPRPPLGRASAVSGGGSLHTPACESPAWPGPSRCFSWRPPHSCPPLLFSHSGHHRGRRQPVGPGFPGASWRPSLWDEGALALLAAGFPFLHFLSPERVGAGGPPAVPPGLFLHSRCRRPVGAG